MSPDIQSEVLKAVRVVGDVWAVEGRVASELLVAIGEVVDVVLAESRDVVKTVDQVRCPENETVAFTYVPALSAHLRKHAAC